MALKSKEWFYKECLAEVKGHGPLSHLSWDILEKGIGQSNGTRGHVKQAIGVSQKFLEKFPNHIPAIQNSDPTKPFDVANNPAVQADLKKFLSTQSGGFGNGDYGYDFDTFKNNTTPTLGGTRKGGGGADDEFKRVLRLVADF